MFSYIFTLFCYLLIEPCLSFFIKVPEIVLIIKLFGIISLLMFFKRDFKFKMKFDLMAIVIGIVIAIIWVALDPVYFDAKKGLEPLSILWIILKLMVGVAIAPVIEEFFTRYFLSRWIISKKFVDVPLGKFTSVSFVATVLFFGLSHDRWLAGLLTGILLNLLFYRRKNIESCILAHSIANLALGIYVIYFGQWQFW